MENAAAADLETQLAATALAQVITDLETQLAATCYETQHGLPEQVEKEKEDLKKTTLSVESWTDGVCGQCKHRHCGHCGHCEHRQLCCNCRYCN
jgi:hypothetical protein